MALSQPWRQHVHNESADQQHTKQIGQQDVEGRRDGDPRIGEPLAGAEKLGWYKGVRHALVPRGAAPRLARMPPMIPPWRVLNKSHWLTGRTAWSAVVAPLDRCYHGE